MLSATKKWLSLKLSSVIMVPFMIWFLIKIVTIYDDDYHQVEGFMEWYMDYKDYLNSCVINNIQP